MEYIKMRISNNYSPNFGIKFLNNNAFKDVHQYAVKNNKLQTLKTALEKLQSAKEGTVIINHGNDMQNVSYSTFKLNNTIIENTPYFDEKPVEASYRAIIDLAALDSRYRVLTEGEVNYRRF